MMNMAAQRAGFENSAQLQAYQQAAGRGQFANAGAAQRLAHGQAAFNAAQAARNQYMQEQYARRNQPINEITALPSGSQVSNPNFINTPGDPIPTTDVAGIINSNFNHQLGIYQQQSQQFNQIVGGIFGAAGSIGAGAAFRSDRRVKKDVDRVGSVFAAGDDGARHELPI